MTRLEVRVEQWFPNYKKEYALAKENSLWIVKDSWINHKPGKLAKTIRFNIEDFVENEYDDDGNYIGKKKNGFMLWVFFRGNFRVFYREYLENWDLKRDEV